MQQAMLEERQFVIQTRLLTRLESSLTDVQLVLLDHFAQAITPYNLAQLVIMETQLVCHCRLVVALALRGISALPVHLCLLRTPAAALRTTVRKEALPQLRASSH